MPASIESGPGWRLYRNNPGPSTAWFILFLGALIVGSILFGSPFGLEEKAMVLTPLCLFFGLIAYAIIKWKSDVRIDVAAGTVVVSSGWGVAKPIRQYALSDFEAVDCYTLGKTATPMVGLTGGWENGSAKCQVQQFDSKKERDAEAKTLSELTGLPIRDRSEPGFPQIDPR